MSRQGGWMQTASGRQFYPMDPKAADVAIEDIAHALSNICRFGGHTREFYSVAQHSVLVSQIVPPELALVGLLHDASEAYIGDLIRPLKTAPEFSRYRMFEHALMAEIYSAMGLSPSADLCEAIKLADNRALATEKRDVMGPARAEWEELPEPWPTVIVPWAPKLAKAAFLARYWYLESDRREREIASADPADYGFSRDGRPL